MNYLCLCGELEDVEQNIAILVRVYNKQFSKHEQSCMLSNTIQLVYFSSKQVCFKKCENLDLICETFFKTFFNFFMSR